MGTVSRVASGDSRISTRSARITIVPCAITTLPLKTTTWRCRSTVPGLSASMTIGLARSAFSAQAVAGAARPAVKKRVRQAGMKGPDI
jgi:hypothetical protein